MPHPPALGRQAPAAVDGNAIVRLDFSVVAD